MDTTALQTRCNLILPHLNERQRRLFLAAEAKSLGWGGITQVHQISGVSRVTITKGLSELNNKSIPQEKLSKSQSRRSGGGRKKIQAAQPGIVKELDGLVDSDSRGDPESPLRWTVKSTRELADVLQQKGFAISHTKVAQLLKYELGYSLQGNAKTQEGSTHADRDSQFQYINQSSREFLKEDSPIISVDTKKKELIGNFKNNGREWRPQGRPEKVNTYDFPDKGRKKDRKPTRAIPYGVYDLKENLGWVNVGVTKDTAQFAVESIRRWWAYLGKKRYPKAEKILITADSGGSNGRRNRLWKKELQSFANQTGLEVTVCHFPPGTSKWNKIEHRLFCHISMNWRGRPLISLKTIINLISSTKTRTGLRVYAMIDKNTYQTGIKISDEEMNQINLHQHQFHGEWNYTIKPQQNLLKM